MSFVQHPWTWVFGAMFGFMVLGSFVPLMAEKVADTRDDLYPVITDWVVTQAVVIGDDVVLRGTMRKQRECLLVPPVIARDTAGVPYVLLTDLWAAKAASRKAISWGPWRIVAGAHRELEFTMVYLCAGNRPNIIRVGSYIPQTDPAKPGATP